MEVELDTTKDQQTKCILKLFSIMTRRLIHFYQDDLQ